MTKYLTVIIGIILSSCSNGQKIAMNGIENTNNGINKQQSELIFNNTKTFPNNTQVSIAIIKNGNIDFTGIERISDSIKFFESYLLF